MISSFSKIRETFENMGYYPFIRKKEGKIYHSPFFGLLVNKRSEIKDQRLESRFGLIVSKKVHKRAVKRNRVKRLLRESVRLLLPKVKPGFDAVFLTKKKILEEEKKKREEELALEEERISEEKALLEAKKKELEKEQKDSEDKISNNWRGKDNG